MGDSEILLCNLLVSPHYITLCLSGSERHESHSWRPAVANRYDASVELFLVNGAMSRWWWWGPFYVASYTTSPLLECCWYEIKSQTKYQQLYRPFLASRHEQPVRGSKGGSVSVIERLGRHWLGRLGPKQVLLTIGLVQSFVHTMETNGPKGPWSSSISSRWTLGIALVFKIRSSLESHES